MFLPLDLPEIVPLSKRHPEAQAERWRQDDRGASKMTAWQLTRKAVMMVIKVCCHDGDSDWLLLPKDHFWPTDELKSALVSLHDASKLRKHFFLNSVYLMGIIYNFPPQLLDSDSFSFMLKLDAWKHSWCFFVSYLVLLARWFSHSFFCTN